MVVACIAGSQQRSQHDSANLLEITSSALVDLACPKSLTLELVDGDNHLVIKKELLKCPSSTVASDPSESKAANDSCIRFVWQKLKLISTIFKAYTEASLPLEKINKQDLLDNTTKIDIERVKDAIEAADEFQDGEVLLWPNVLTSYFIYEAPEELYKAFQKLDDKLKEWKKRGIPEAVSNTKADIVSAIFDEPSAIAHKAHLMKLLRDNPNTFYRLNTIDQPSI